MPSRLQNEMIKYACAGMDLQLKARTLMTDYELAIQMAAEEAFPWIELRGCRFHFAQAS